MIKLKLTWILNNENLHCAYSLAPSKIFSHPTFHFTAHHSCAGIPTTILLHSTWHKIQPIRVSKMLMPLAFKGYQIRKHVFIFKMGFGMSFHFQNVVLFRNVLSFSKCERFRDFWFPFSEKHNISWIKTKSADLYWICTVTKNSFTDEVVTKQRNIYKAFKFVSVVKNL